MRCSQLGRGRRGLPALGLTLALASILGAGSTKAAQVRCGWLEKPTPANYELRDPEAEWTLSEQGGFHAKGMDTLPDMTTAGWVQTNGCYGYGCACLTVTVNRKRTRIVELLSAKPLPLVRCRADPKLPHP